MGQEEPGDEWMLLCAVAVVLVAAADALAPVAVSAEIVVAVELLSCRRLLLVAVCVVVDVERRLVQGRDQIESFDDSDDNIQSA